MARINAQKFERATRELCANSSIVVRVIMLSESIDHTQLRIFLTDRSFIDLYYHYITGKTAYAQIRDNERIFGADNARGYWHWHPRENPALHIKTDREITFEEFMKELETSIK